jgi:hypothetical protein
VPTLERRVINLEEILADFIAESRRITASIHEEIAEMRLSNARTDRILLEIQQRADRDRQQADRDRQQADRDRQQADKDRQQADKDRKDFNRRMAILTDQQGLMIENMVWPNLPRIAEEVFGGDSMIFSGIRLKRRHSGESGWNMEIDLLAASPNQVLVCEAKSKVDAAKAREFLDKLAGFTAYFPEYEQHQLMPMMASIAFDDSVLKHLTKQGILALGFGGDTMDLLNPELLAGRRKA